jgi:Fe2+ transport system protein B
MDLEAEGRKLNQEALKAFAEKYGMPIMETSAKEGKGVHAVIEKMIEMSVKYYGTGSRGSSVQDTAQRKQRTNCHVL